MTVDTRKESVEAFIQGALKDHVLSEGMPRTSTDTHDAYAVVELLRSFLEKVEALEPEIARLRAKVAKLEDALAPFAEAADEADEWPLDDHNQAPVDVGQCRAARAAYCDDPEGEI